MDCDEPIPEGRRLALPGIATCVPCQKRRENDQKNRERR
ncbi:MAG TPA: TraR/DksA C4-type zinc finger protein [Accumulibacter sp.]|nr:TraR/DksA C4-type zinc finger protein [Accumulibacter sp.]